MPYTLRDPAGRDLDFFNEMTKYAGFLRTSHLSRHLAIYELYKKTLELPGSVAEFGLYNGSTFFYLARLIEIFHQAQHETHHSSSRHLFGFEGFTGLSAPAPEDATAFAAPVIKREGGLTADRESFFTVLDDLRQTSPIADRLHVVEGDIHTTFPAFLTQNPGVKLCLALVDFDIYSPTKAVLDRLYDCMVPGGVIIFDEYAFPDWPGETLAVDAFTKRQGLSLLALPWTFAPAAYAVVPS
jgi:3-O-methyltransferase